jgi:ankyrin repeat protein
VPTDTINADEFPSEPPTKFVPDRANPESCQDETFYVKKSQIGYADSEVINERCASLQTGLANAAAEGNVVEMRRFFRKGASAQSRAFAQNGGGDAFAPIISAVWGGHVEAVKLLLDNGAYVNTVYSCCMSSRSLIMLAVSGNHVAITKLLLARNADLSYKSPYSDEEVYDVFYEAHQENNPVILEMLNNLTCERSVASRIRCRLNSVLHLF